MYYISLDWNKKNQIFFENCLPFIVYKSLSFIVETRHSTPKQAIYWAWFLGDIQINLGLDLEFNSIHFGIEINKRLKFLGLKIYDVFENSKKIFLEFRNLFL